MWLAVGALSGTKFTSMSSQEKMNFSSYNVFTLGLGLMTLRLKTGF